MARVTVKRPEIGDVVQVKRGCDVAWRVVGFGTVRSEDDDGYSVWEDDYDRLVVVMIGDDHKETYDVEDCEVIAREAYCGECGQIGCTHDGYERED